VEVSEPSVIASEAKQSIAPQPSMDCFVACAPRNDGVTFQDSQQKPRLHRGFCISALCTASVRQNRQPQQRHRCCDLDIGLTAGPAVSL